MQASTPSSDEEEVEETQHAPSSTYIVMGTESMQIDSTHIFVDTKENPFATFKTTIVGNITAYSSLDEEEEATTKKQVEEKRKEEAKM